MNLKNLRDKIDPKVRTLKFTSRWLDLLVCLTIIRELVLQNSVFHLSEVT